MLENDEVILVAGGALAAVFVGGLLVAVVLRPFVPRLAGSADGAITKLENAGTLIGWFERAVFFAFLVSGESQAAAVALAAKSFARFPALRRDEEHFAEYFLIGSLMSLSIATAAAMATRAMLGLSPL